MSPSAEDSWGPIEFLTSTTSPGWAKLKNHAARWVERLMQPCDTLRRPCCPTDHGAACTNSPLFEMRTAYSTSARYPPGASTARPKVLESMVIFRRDSVTTCGPLRVGFAALPALIGKVCTSLSASNTCSVCAPASAIETCLSPTWKLTVRSFSPHTASPKTTPERFAFSVPSVPGGQYFDGRK